MTPDELRLAVERLAAAATPPRDAARAVIEGLFSALESGLVRAAEPTPGGWRVHAWVKKGILLAFRVGVNVDVEAAPPFAFRERDTLATWSPRGAGREVRIVPGGTTVRRGAFLGEGVVVMPPAYVNVGAWVGDGAMIDSHVLVSVSVNDLKEFCYSTPAIADGRLYLRTGKHLFCIGPSQVEADRSDSAKVTGDSR